MTRLIALKALLDVSNKLLGNFISKNTLEPSDEELYQIITKTKRSIDRALFLIPDHTINELKRDSAFDESEIENYLNQIQLINLSIFTFNVLKEQEYESCVNNFFRSITCDNEVKHEEIEFYVKLRHNALVDLCKKQKNIDFSEAINSLFPQDVDKFYFSPDKANNYEVTASVDCYRRKLQKELREEILSGPTFSDDDTLEAFVRNRYENLVPKLQFTLKRKSVEESSERKKARTTYISTIEVSASKKAEAANIIRQKHAGEKLPVPEIFENDSNLIMDSREVEPVSEPEYIETIEITDSDSDYECDEAETREVEKFGEQDTNNSQETDRLTQQFDELIEEMNEEETNQATEPNQPSTSSNNNARNSPDDSDSEPAAIIMTRKVRKQSSPWTKEEVKALEEGLKKFRRPYWADIIRNAKPALNNRTGPQLKDKARTMIGELKRRGLTEPDQLGAYKYVQHPDPDERYGTIRKRK